MTPPKFLEQDIFGIDYFSNMCWMVAIEVIVLKIFIVVIIITFRGVIAAAFKLLSFLLFDLLESPANRVVVGEFDIIQFNQNAFLLKLYRTFDCTCVSVENVVDDFAFVFLLFPFFLLLFVLLLLSV